MADRTMRAARFHAYGPVENLVIEDVPRPEPKAGDVLVRVHAAGVNPVDWKIRQGWLKDFIPVAFPAIPGLDLAGTVAAVGPDVTTLELGQDVFGQGIGTYAEYATAPAAMLAPKPANLSFDEAAAVPLGAATAWAGIFDVGGLQSGQRLLVHGAAGGVGVYAVQLGRWKGAEVLGTASTANVGFLGSLGAQAIDYTTTPFETMAHDVDVVLDTIGGEVGQRSFQVLRPGGILVTVTAPASEEEAHQHGVRVGMAYGQPAPERMREIAALLAQRVLTPVVGRVFPLAEARQAQALSETGHGRGRIILHIAD